MTNRLINKGKDRKASVLSIVKTKQNHVISNQLYTKTTNHIKKNIMERKEWGIFPKKTLYLLNTLQTE